MQQSRELLARLKRMDAFDTQNFDTTVRFLYLPLRYAHLITSCMRGHDLLQCMDMASRQGASFAHADMSAGQ